MASAADFVHLSWRGLRARRVRSILTMVAVAVATAGLTVFLSLAVGLRAAVNAQVNSIRPQLQVSRAGLLQSLAPPPDMSESVVRQVEAQRASLQLTHVTPVILAPQERGGLHVTLYGIPASAGFQRVYPYVRAASGRMMRPEDEDASVVVLGDAVARRLGVRVGDAVDLTVRERVNVVGVMERTSTLTDAFVIAPLGTLQRALDVPGFVSLVAVEVARDADVPFVARKLTERVDAEVHTQRAAREVVARLLRGVDASQWALASVALLVGFLSVLTTITMASFERRVELAVLRALGLRPAQAAGLIVLDGVLLACAGGAAGLLAGCLLSFALGLVTEVTLGVRATVTTWSVVSSVSVVSVLIGGFAALPGAWAASRRGIPDGLRAS
ncbi:ABC transporter permease [Deinococcus yavapaiensis]|uniref:Putative ABC transport system permease protein n=1 Tax=Deinococcus yavapaiensis KR-236 TaxID=694435 RepID=A0A318S802_9DEIO|nr:ABC transporter permease [Deinococcus yavapaiensis]PYE55186.1 putative ABC transport system permease protein [Deinococcus yavapaiensis KR-236]